MHSLAFIAFFSLKFFIINNKYKSAAIIILKRKIERQERWGFVVESLGLQTPFS